MTIFDEATAVRSRGDGLYDALPDQRFAVVVPGGTVPPAVNGGVLIATVLRAVLDTSPHPYPIATSAHFLRVAKLEPASIQVSWQKQGRTAATARAVLLQDALPVLDVTITTGALPARPSPARPHPARPGPARPGPARLHPARPGPARLHPARLDPARLDPARLDPARLDPARLDPARLDPARLDPARLDPARLDPARPHPGRPPEDAELSWTGAPPGFPPIEECVDLGPWPGTAGADGTVGYAAQVHVVLDPATTGWRRGEPSGVPEMRGYFRLREDREPDAYLLALAVDGMPPVVFGLGLTGWSPTVELSWHMRAVPSPGPLRVATRCRHVSGGWFDEEAEVWDWAGQLVAQSRQIARTGRGRLRLGPASSGQ